MSCPHCHSTDLDVTDASVSCRSCGLVLEESQIVSDVTFAENSAGGAVVQGSYVGNEQREWTQLPREQGSIGMLKCLSTGGARTQGPGGYRSGGAGASREQTVANGERKARFVARWPILESY